MFVMNYEKPIFMSLYLLGYKSFILIIKIILTKSLTVYLGKKMTRSLWNVSEGDTVIHILSPIFSLPHVLLGICNI